MIQSWVPVVRNREGIQFADLRKVIDPTFEQLHDTLSDAYYNYWRHGNSRRWQGYDVQDTLAKSKTLFDTLHGLIFHHREVAFHEANMQQPVAKRLAIDEYSPVVEVAEDKSTRTIRSYLLATEKIAELAAKGITIKV